MEYSGINDTGFQDIISVIELPFRTYRNIPVTTKGIWKYILGNTVEYREINNT